jgi:hypothetical protein
MIVEQVAVFNFQGVNIKSYGGRYERDFRTTYWNTVAIRNFSHKHMEELSCKA